MFLFYKFTFIFNSSKDRLFCNDQMFLSFMSYSNTRIQIKCYNISNNKPSRISFFRNHTNTEWMLFICARVIQSVDRCSLNKKLTDQNVVVKSFQNFHFLPLFDLSV